MQVKLRPHTTAHTSAHIELYSPDFLLQGSSLPQVPLLTAEMEPFIHPYSLPQRRFIYLFTGSRPVCFLSKTN